MNLIQAGFDEPAIHNAENVRIDNMMKSLTEYMNPDFLTHDSNAVQAETPSVSV